MGKSLKFLGIVLLAVFLFCFEFGIDPDATGHVIEILLYGAAVIALLWFFWAMIQTVIHPADPAEKTPRKKKKRTIRDRSSQFSDEEMEEMEDLWIMDTLDPWDADAQKQSNKKR